MKIDCFTIYLPKSQDVVALKVLPTIYFPFLSQRNEEKKL